MAPHKYETVAGLVRDMIADGTLKPGAPAPSGAALARETGFCTLTCRKALRALLADGTLTWGASPNARLRVAAGPTASGAKRGALRVPLSSALAARRHAAGLTQPQLATLLGMSVTTVGHAETGRLWQSREFWLQADQVLGAAGTLLGMYDQRQAAAGRTEEFPGAPDPSPAVLPPVSVTITLEGVNVVWPDGSETLARPPGCQNRAAAGQSRE